MKSQREEEVLENLGESAASDAAAISYRKLKRKHERLQRELLHATRINERNNHFLKTILEESREKSRAIEEKERELRALCDQVNHDINSPLKTLKKLSTSSAFKIDEGGRRAASCAASSVWDILEDLRRYSRELQFESFNLNELLSDAVAEKKLNFPAVSVQMNLMAEKVQITGIKASDLKRVVCNLLNNAIEATRATPEPSVELVLEPATPSDASDQYRLSVIDNGSGISQEIRHSIWERGFSTNEKTVSHQKRGLGLSFVREKVCSWGGKIELVESAPGRTCFSFTVSSNK